MRVVHRQSLSCATTLIGRSRNESGPSVNSPPQMEECFHGKCSSRVKEVMFANQALTALRASKTAQSTRTGDYFVRRGSTGLDEGLVAEVRVDTLGRVGCSDRVFEARVITASRFR